MGLRCRTVRTSLSELIMSGKWCPMQVACLRFATGQIGDHIHCNSFVRNGHMADTPKVIGPFQICGSTEPMSHQDFTGVLDDSRCRSATSTIHLHSPAHRLPTFSNNLGPGIRRGGLVRPTWLLDVLGVSIRLEELCSLSFSVQFQPSLVLT